jgi:hypothetical protein
MTAAKLRLVWNRDDEINNLLYAPGTFIGGVVQAAFDNAANPDQGPLPADELELFKAQVAALPNMQGVGCG